jgi:arabinan endo-1,5-alpha-L-arabinosidase
VVFRANAFIYSLVTFLFPAIFLAGCSTEYSIKAALTYTNPVYAGDMPDPSVKKFGDYYYAFGTTGPVRMPDGRIFKLLRSRDLVNWEPLGGALTPPFANRDFEYWAPEITQNQGRYYLYYAMGDDVPEHFVIRVGISDKPKGPYTDSGNVLKDCDGKRFMIDPFPFRDDDGNWYLFYSCSFPYDTQEYHAGTGVEVERLINMTTLSGDCHLVVRPAHDWTLYKSNRWMNVYNRAFNWHTVEGPCVVRHDGKYYCFYSGSNWTTANYGEDYVVADNPLGPYSPGADRPRVLQGIPGKVRGPGGISITTGPDGKTQYIVYHAWNREMTERQMCVDKLVWTADGPRSTPTVTPQVMVR